MTTTEIPTTLSDDSAKTELVQRSFPIENLTVRVRTNMIEPGIDAIMEEVNVWISRDHPRGPHAYVGFDDGDEKGENRKKILLLNAARLDTDRGVAQILLTLTHPDMSVSQSEGKRVVEAALEAAGIHEANVEVRETQLLAAAKTMRDTRESAKQKTLAAARAAGQLPAAPAADADASDAYPTAALPEGDTGDPSASSAPST